MENKFNLLKEILLFLQSYTRTNFGSAVVGFLLCGTILYYGIIKNQTDDIASYKAENNDLKNTLKQTNDRIVLIKEEARQEAIEEQKVYFEYVYDMINKMRSEVNIKKVQTEKDIKELERELNVRKNKSL